MVKFTIVEWLSTSNFAENILRKFMTCMNRNIAMPGKRRSTEQAVTLLILSALLCIAVFVNPTVELRASRINGGLWMTPPANGLICLSPIILSIMQQLIEARESVTGDPAAANRTDNRPFNDMIRQGDAPQVQAGGAALPPWVSPVETSFSFVLLRERRGRTTNSQKQVPARGKEIANAFQELKNCLPYLSQIKGLHKWIMNIKK